ncbi:unnamed protein product [Arabidopsis halleri]
MKLAHQIYSKDYGVKFTLDHCWRELRHDRSGVLLLHLQRVTSQKEER